MTAVTRPVTYVVTEGGRARRVETSGGGGRYRLALDGEVWEVDVRRTAPGIYSLLIDGASWVAEVAERDGAWVVEVGGESSALQVEEETRYIIRTRGGAAAGAGTQTLTAPLPGRIAHVAVAAGDAVEAGATLLIIEAMKMENEFKAGRAGTVREVRVRAGEAVNAGDVLVVID
jgi:biotin carboxyl carrier protein